MGACDVVIGPVLGPLRVVQRLGRWVIGLAVANNFDETRLLSEIVRLQVKYDMGKISKETFYRRHKALVRRANVIRRANPDAG